MTTVGNAGEQFLQGCEALIDARKYEQALALSYHALATDAGSAKGHALAARALLGLERYEDAAREAREATKLSPQTAYYHRLGAVALNKLARQREGPARKAVLADAVAEGCEAVRLAPFDPANHTVLAESYAWSGDTRQAERAVREAIRLRPNSADCWASASFVATQGRNWLAAEIAARKALAIDPQNYTATNNLGVALRRRGKWLLGAVAFQDAARIDPRSPTARDNVESIGFQYLTNVALLLLIPLVLVWPLYFAACGGLKRMNQKRPERLRPFARRLGIRLATSKRRQRRYAKAMAQAEKRARSLPAGEWSSLRGYSAFDGDIIGMSAGICLVLGGAAIWALELAFAKRSSSPTAGLFLVGALLVAYGIRKLRLVARRQRRQARPGGR